MSDNAAACQFFLLFFSGGGPAQEISIISRGWGGGCRRRSKGRKRRWGLGVSQRGRNIGRPGASEAETGEKAAVATGDVPRRRCRANVTSGYSRFNGAAPEPRVGDSAENATYVTGIWPTFAISGPRRFHRRTPWRFRCGKFARPPFVEDESPTARVGRKPQIVPPVPLQGVEDAGG